MKGLESNITMMTCHDPDKTEPAGFAISSSFFKAAQLLGVNSVMSWVILNAGKLLLFLFFFLNSSSCHSFGDNITGWATWEPDIVKQTQSRPIATYVHTAKKSITPVNEE